LILKSNEDALRKGVNVSIYTIYDFDIELMVT